MLVVLVKLTIPPQMEISYQPLNLHCGKTDATQKDQQDLIKPFTIGDF